MDYAEGMRDRYILLSNAQPISGIPAYRHAQPFSSTVRNPSCAIISRNSSATKKKKLMTCSGVPSNFARRADLSSNADRHVFEVTFSLIMMQPIEIKGIVEKPNSSAPNNAAIATSRPVCNLPSVCSRTRLPQIVHSTSTCCASASPISHGIPACFNRGERRRTGSAGITANKNRICMCLCNSGWQRYPTPFSRN